MPTAIFFLSVIAAGSAGDCDTSPNPEQLKLLKTFRDEFILIEPGTEPYPTGMMMGSREGPVSERPAHRVRLVQEFWIAKYEVPQNLWQAVMGTNPSKWKGPRNSVEMVNFDEANQFCRKATAWMRAGGLIEPDQVIRLPSEAEWEFVARAGTETRYSFGEDVRQLGAYGWFTGNAAGNDPPVGAKKPNPWGLYDTHGYLWEWCADPWNDDYTGAPEDAAVWSEGGDPQRRVLRGGSWKDGPEKLTSTYRRPAEVTTRDDAVGLRCVLAESP